jgi:thymidine phosphorylase
MGCGRKNISDSLDNTAGIKFNVKVGDYIKRGDQIMSCFNSNSYKLAKAHSKLIKTIQISEEKVESPNMIYRD